MGTMLEGPNHSKVGESGTWFFKESPPSRVLLALFFILHLDGGGGRMYNRMLRIPLLLSSRTDDGDGDDRFAVLFVRFALFVNIEIPLKTTKTKRRMRPPAKNDKRR